MDEYFCPNCGATLNDQLGFDLNGGTWTCTSCGKLLMDEDVYDGDTVEGVAWYCDDCGALLNRQPGFSDFYGSWQCTNCGHINGTTEDDIVDDGPKSSASGDLSDALAGLFTVVFEAGFAAYSRKKQQEREEEAQRQAEEERIRLEKAKERKVRNELWKKRAKAFLFKGKKIAVPCDYEDLIGRNASYVAHFFSEYAFSDVKMIPIKDIYRGSTHKVGQVEQVIIGGSAYFRAGDMLPYDVEIIITYHEKKEITIPYSERNLRSMNYIEAGERLQELGFTEIYEKPIRDLVTGWVKKDGAVEKVTIGSACPFKKNSVFPYDIEITIEYHTFKKK